MSRIAVAKPGPDPVQMGEWKPTPRLHQDLVAGLFRWSDLANPVFLTLVDVGWADHVRGTKHWGWSAVEHHEVAPYLRELVVGKSIVSTDEGVVLRGDPLAFMIKGRVIARYLVAVNGCPDHDLTPANQVLFYADLNPQLPAGEDLQIQGVLLLGGPPYGADLLKFKAEMF